MLEGLCIHLPRGLSPRVSVNTHSSLEVFVRVQVRSWWLETEKTLWITVSFPLPVRFCSFRRCICNRFVKALEKWLKMKQSSSLVGLFHIQQSIRIVVLFFFLTLSYIFLCCNYFFMLFIHHLRNSSNNVLWSLSVISNFLLPRCALAVPSAHGAEFLSFLLLGCRASCFPGNS